MKSSDYNIFFPNINSNKIILYNTLYGSISVWTKEEFDIVQKCFLESHTTQLKYPDIFQTLLGQKNIIEDSVNELDLILKRKSYGIMDNNRLDVVIIPTLDCNFRCIYCYENHYTSSMSEDTEKKIKLWFLKEIPKHKLVLVHWYGGEPLLKLNSIISITIFLNTLVKKNNIFLVTHITTNGYLLNEKISKNLIDIGITDFQITLDGLEETHNQMRPLKNGGKSFDIIFNNIIQLTQSNSSVKITLRINFNHKNFFEIPELLNSFPINIRSQLRVVFEPIFGSEKISAIHNLSSFEISRGLANYYVLAKNLGYDITLGELGIHPGKLVYCYAERENQVIINFNGDTFKCSVSTFNKKDRVGFFANDGSLIIEKDNWEKWINKDLFEEKCYSCKYLPLCMGGCKRMRINNQYSHLECNLVPTNSSYILKQIFFSNLDEYINSIQN